MLNICNIIVGIVEIGCGCVSSKFGTPVKATSSKWIPLSRHHFSIAFPYTHYFLLFYCCNPPITLFCCSESNHKLIPWSNVRPIDVSLDHVLIPRIVFKILTRLEICQKIYTTGFLGQKCYDLI